MDVKLTVLTVQPSRPILQWLYFIHVIGPSHDQIVSEVLGDVLIMHIPNINLVPNRLVVYSVPPHMHGNLHSQL